jgi:glycosyltransferase involved in cell wall biosynthesis
MEELPGMAELKPTYPTYFYPPRVLQHRYAEFLWWSTRSVLRTAIREHRSDYVLSYWAHPDGAVAVRAAHEQGIPGGFIVGGSDVLVLGTQKGARAEAIGKAIRTADSVIGVSAHLRDAAIRLGARRDCAHAVYQGIDDKLFHPGDRAEARRRLGIQGDGPVLLFVGNLQPVKGLEVMVAACKQLRVRGQDFRLYLVGDGPCRESLISMVNSMGLENHISVRGAVVQRELGDWYRAADLTVMSSHSEGIPNVLRESVACGTPFVATCVGGIREIADGTDNILVPPADPAALADAIIRSLSRGKSVKLQRELFENWVQSAARLVKIMSAGRGASAEVRSGLVPRSLLR